MNPRILRSVFLPAWQKLRKHSGLRTLPDLQASQWLPPGKIRQLQLEKLAPLLSHACQCVPYYREAMQSSGLTPDDVIANGRLDLLPLLDRQTIMQRRPDLIARNISRRRRLANSTGGSTGEPLRFLDDYAGAGLLDATVYRAQGWVGVQVGARTVCLWGSNFDVSRWEGLIGRTRASVFNMLMLSAWQLSARAADEFAQQTIRFEPEVIVAYAGAMQKWCELLDTQVRIPTLKGIVVSAEMLQPAWRATIERTFGVPVFNRYGGRDIKCVAQECEVHSGMHINAESIIVEVIRDGKAVGPFEHGELVITRLDNYVMPFIRYRCGDLGSLSDAACPCGRGLPLLATVDGRTADLIVTPSGKFVSGLLFAHMLKEFPTIRHYQVHQTAPGNLDIWLVTDPPLQMPDRDRIARTVRANLGSEMELQFTLRNDIPCEPNGKRRPTVSHMRPERPAATAGGQTERSV